MDAEGVDIDLLQSLVEWRSCLELFLVNRHNLCIRTLLLVEGVEPIGGL